MRKLRMPRLRKRTVALAVVLGLLPVIGLAAPAQAASCSGWRLYYLDAGPAAASVWISDTCSDGRIHLDGTVYDESCDNRTARLNLRFWEDGDLNGVFWPYRTENVYAGGCGTSKYYEFNTVDRTSISNDMYVRACVWAENSTGSSSSDCESVWP